MESTNQGARVISVNVGKPQQVTFSGRTTLTSIFKAPVRGAVAVRATNLAGDQQADLRVHGGPYKAVYSYSAEHYAYWKDDLGLAELNWGAFGENLTTANMTEETLVIGDQFQVGSSILQVAQPRMPCFKLAIRFERADMVKKFWVSERSGTYFSVVQEGDLQAEDSIEKIAAGPEQVTVADVVRLYKGVEWSQELREKALASPLRGGWKRGISERLTESA